MEEHVIWCPIVNWPNYITIITISDFVGIKNSMEDGLFTYSDKESWNTFYQPNFVPFFEPVVHRLKCN